MADRSPAAARVEHVSKCYRPPTGRRRRAEHWALRDVDVELAPGETLGVLGHNGAGKTTLLRLLAGVTQPTRGRIEVRGRSAPLITVGVGFHQELTGRENVALNAMLLGLTRRELADRYEAITAFSELEAAFLETPVKLYSSGMLMRLAFSVAMHVEPDVLLVDEVLAVGDLAFQLKCFDRMRQLRDLGTTIVLVSHSLHAVRALCPRAIVLDEGQLAFDGEVAGAVASYLDVLAVRRADGGVAAGASVIASEIVDAAGQRPSELRAGERYQLLATVRIDDPVASVGAVVTVVGETGAVAYEHRVEQLAADCAAGSELSLAVDFVASMGGGTYRVGLRLLDGGGTVLYEDDARWVLYRPPIPGSYGVTELAARIEVDGLAISDHVEDGLAAG